MNLRRVSRAPKDRTIWREFGLVPGHYGFCPSEKAWRKTMKNFGVKDLNYPKSDGSHTELASKDTGSLACVVTVTGDKGRSANQVIGLLAHEAMHVWRALREDIGEKTPSSEFEAYTLQNIIMGLISAYQETRKPLLRSTPQR